MPVSRHSRLGERTDPEAKNRRIKQLAQSSALAKKNWRPFLLAADLPERHLNLRSSVYTFYYGLIRGCSVMHSCRERVICGVFVASKFQSPFISRSSSPGTRLGIPLRTTDGTGPNRACWILDSGRCCGRIHGPPALARLSWDRASWPTCFFFGQGRGRSIAASGLYGPVMPGPKW